ncbi:MAG: hypothetical protein IGQ45_12510, partial [Cyanobacterium sp. T60_A2020_053]|nr:hypothetical protein [Cyanobacterium sp. T60_A2020_053]
VESEEDAGIALFAEDDSLSTDDLGALDDGDDFSFDSVESEEDAGIALFAEDDSLSAEDLGALDDGDDFSFDSVESSESQIQSFKSDDSFTSDFDVSDDENFNLDFDLSDNDELDFDSFNDESDSVKTEINPLGNDDRFEDEDFDFGSLLEDNEEK